MKPEQVLAQVTVSVSDRLAKVTAERNVYLEALDRIMEDYQTYIPVGVKMVIDRALTDRCPRCRWHRPLYKVGNPYISRFYDRLCILCLREEVEHYD